MKISPMPQGGQGTALGSIEVNKSPAINPEISPTPRKLTIKTNQTVLRAPEVLEQAAAAVEQAAQTTESGQSTVPDNVEAGTEEVTKPLSPQFAALAKQKRALQLEREAFAKEKAAFESSKTTGSDLEAFKQHLKASPLSVLLENGVTYDDLTNAILSGNDGNPEIQALKAELKATKEAFEKQLTDRDSNQEQAALAEMRREADRLANLEQYETVKATGSVPKVIDLIHRTYKESGEVLDVSEAMQLVEDELVNDAIKLAGLKKVQGKLAPTQTTQQSQQLQEKQMRTLTARDTAAPVMDRKARAIAAMLGQLRK